MHPNLLKRSRFLQAAVLVWLLGWGPIVGYVIWEEVTDTRGGNPIGLGLMAFLATGAAFCLGVVGLVRASIPPVEDSWKPSGGE